MILALFLSTLLLSTSCLVANKDRATSVRVLNNESSVGPGQPAHTKQHHSCKQHGAQCAAYAVANGIISAEQEAPPAQSTGKHRELVVQVIRHVLISRLKEAILISAPDNKPQEIETVLTNCCAELVEKHLSHNDAFAPLKISVAQLKKDLKQKLNTHPQTLTIQIRQISSTTGRVLANEFMTDDMNELVIPSEWVDTQELEHVVDKLSKDANAPKMFCFDLSSNAHQVEANITSFTQEVKEAFDTWKKQLDEETSCTPAVLLLLVTIPHSPVLHWISVTAVKKDGSTDFRVADSLNYDREQDPAVQQILQYLRNQPVHNKQYIAFEHTIAEEIMSTTEMVVLSVVLAIFIGFAKDHLDHNPDTYRTRTPESDSISVLDLLRVRHYANATEPQFIF